MFKVVCIDDGDHYPKKIKKGCVYTVLDEIFYKGGKDDEYTYLPGKYYSLIETGEDDLFHFSMFLPIQEGQQDETTFERNFQTQTI